MLASPLSAVLWKFYPLHCPFSPRLMPLNTKIMCSNPTGSWTHVSEAGRTLRRRQRSPRRAEQRRFLWFTRFSMSAQVERKGRAAQFCVCVCLRHAVIRTQFCNAAHAGQSSADFCVSHVWVCQHELRGRAGQHSSTSAFACTTSI